MRKPRDLDAELKALHDRQKTLRARKTVQLGELVQATGADALPVEVLAGALLDALARTSDLAVTEAWRRSGEGFFRDGARSPRSDGTGEPQGPPSSDRQGAAPGHRGPAPS